MSVTKEGSVAPGCVSQKGGHLSVLTPVCVRQLFCPRVFSSTIYYSQQHVAKSLMPLRLSSTCTFLSVAVFEKKDRIVLVMDCALGGELYDYLNTKRCLTEVDTRRIFRQIVGAVHYIHQVRPGDLVTT